MCGIAGVLYSDPRRPPDPEVLRRMGASIAHRGPDADGFLIDPGLGLIHRRLSIIDLAGGDQPLGNEDGSIQVVFNGEIYNYVELRRRLESRGHRFRTNSDTEVLVHLYEEHGERLTEHLRGMFAFALWDRPRRRLTLARDHVGQKPLYLYRDAEKLIFGSELKAILAHPDVDRTLDPAAVEDYLTFGMIPGSRSIFTRVRKLRAAHRLTVEAPHFDVEPRRFWQLRFRPDGTRSVEDWKSAVTEKLTETVVAHRIADVPVGAFLSGGLDSSTVVSALTAHGGAKLKTFSIGFDEAEYSELPYARQVAQHFGTDHIEEVVRPQAIGSLEDLVRFYDEPFADSSAIPTMAVARVASQHVKVALSGDGGDEAFGGYARYAHDLQEARIRALLPAWLRRTLVRGAAAAWPRTDWLPRPLRWKSALTNLSLDPSAAYANTLSIVRQPLRRELLNPDLRRLLEGYRPESIVSKAFGNPPDPLGGMLAADIELLLPDDFLTKVDRASMAYGLEVRPPFVDHELLELTAQIPSSLKVCRGETKWLLKELMDPAESGTPDREQRPSLPRLPVTLTRRPKQGFEIPIHQWLQGPLAGVFRESVLSPGHSVGELISQSVARRLFDQHQSGTGRHGHVLWSLLVLARWCEEYLSATSVSRTSNSSSTTRAAAVPSAAASASIR
ncbi:MAG: asparagine synthase (glutamine-hydrolyzing) [Planctomycetaceae bacterium]|nr:asparagine synthase (glutamine-hydrolyzing) [Planctomycetaceae bacterium]